MASPLPPNGRPLSGPLNKSCPICRKPRGVLATNALPGRSGKFNPKSYPYYICGTCDRDPVDGFYMPALDGRGTQ